MTIEQIKELTAKMTLDEKVGQIINYDLCNPDFDVSEFENICSETHPGSIFVDSPGCVLKEMGDAERNRYLTDIADRYATVPTVVLSDGHIRGIRDLIPLMAWGAADDPELTEKYGVAYAEMMRKTGIGVFLGPVVDINYNKDNPITSLRAFSDDPDHVIKHGTRFIKGLNKNSNIIACCKHFPGDGTDDRNQHYCTTVNNKSKQEWMDTYGRVYREMFKNGAKAVMCAHISLPSWQPAEECDPINGYLPCSLSPTLMTDLLKGELGFDGCIISDAMNMVGAVSACKREELGVRFIKAGGDMMLFAHPEDFYRIKAAVENGTISAERLDDAVTRVLIMKNALGLLDGVPNIREDLTPSYPINDIIEEAAVRTFVIERNADRVIPTDIKSGDRVLLINLTPECQSTRRENRFDALRDALTERGMRVEVKTSPFPHYELETVCDDYELVLCCCAHIPGGNNGGTMRLGAEHMGPFWDGFGIQHPKFLYVSFGDPYKLYEHPFLRNYVNVYSSADISMRAFVKLLFGEIKAVGKNPVALEGFFEREV